MPEGYWKSLGCYFWWKCWGYLRETWQSTGAHPRAVGLHQRWWLYKRVKEIPEMGATSLRNSRDWLEKRCDEKLVMGVGRKREKGSYDLQLLCSYRRCVDGTNVEQKTLFLYYMKCPIIFKPTDASMSGTWLHWSTKDEVGHSDL